MGGGAPRGGVVVCEINRYALNAGGPKKYFQNPRTRCMPSRILAQEFRDNFSGRPKFDTLSNFEESRVEFSEYFRFGEIGILI